MLATKQFSTVPETNQVATQVLNVRYYMGSSRANDKVYLANGDGFSFSYWLRATDLAARTTSEVLKIGVANLTPEQLRVGKIARRWLFDCGVDTLEKFNLLVSERLPLLHMAPDSPQLMKHCDKCGRPIWGRESVFYRRGSECRRKYGV